VHGKSFAGQITGKTFWINRLPSEAVGGGLPALLGQGQREATVQNLSHFLSEVSNV